MGPEICAPKHTLSAGTGTKPVANPGTQHSSRTTAAWIGRFSRLTMKLHFKTKRMVSFNTNTHLVMGPLNQEARVLQVCGDGKSLVAGSCGPRQTLTDYRATQCALLPPTAIKTGVGGEQEKGKGRTRLLLCVVSDRLQHAQAQQWSPLGLFAWVGVSPACLCGWAGL